MYVSRYNTRMIHIGYSSLGIKSSLVFSPSHANPHFWFSLFFLPSESHHCFHCFHHWLSLVYRFSKTQGAGILHYGTLHYRRLLQALHAPYLHCYWSNIYLVVYCQKCHPILPTTLYAHYSSLPAVAFYIVSSV